MTIGIDPIWAEWATDSDLHTKWAPFLKFIQIEMNRICVVDVHVNCMCTK